MPRFQLLPYHLNALLGQVLFPFLMPTPDPFLDTSLQDIDKQGPSHDSPSTSACATSGTDTNVPGVVPEFTTCVDRSSTFFRILTAPFTPSQPPEPWQAPLRVPLDHPPAVDTQIDLSWCAEGAPITTTCSSHENESPGDLPRGYWPSVLPKNIYTPQGKWEWADGKSFDNVTRLATLHNSKNTFSLFINEGSLGGRGVEYICKSWPKQSMGSFPELALYKCHLKPLQGKLVPSLIGVYATADALNVAMEPPHPVFWIEASSDMPHVLKRRCVDAFQELHDRGVLHGGAELRHMLIGGDGRVTIVGFQHSKALLPNETLGLAKATPEELLEEMSGVKRRLGYDNVERATITSSEAVSGSSEGSQSYALEPIRALPKRFVMPSQTAAQLDDAICIFLRIVDDLIKADLSPCGPTPPSTEPDVSLGTPSGDVPTLRPPYSLRHRIPRAEISKPKEGRQLHKRKNALTNVLAIPLHKRPRRGKPAQSAGGKAITRAIRPIECSKSVSRPHTVIPHLIIPESLPPLDPLTPSPATPSQDPLLLAPPSADSIASSSQPPTTPRPPSPISPRPWNDDPYGRSRAHDNYTQLVALAVKRGVPRFRPNYRPSTAARPPLPQLSVDSETLSGELAHFPSVIGKRKRDDDSDVEHGAPSDSRPRRPPKVLKWSEGTTDSSAISPSNPPSRIRGILKKHNPPAIRSYEMSRIAELSENEDQDLLASHGVLTVEEVDRINDGSRALEEELDDDLDMLIDAQDSDDNFLNGYPMPTGTVTLGEVTGSREEDNLPSGEAPPELSPGIHSGVCPPDHCARTDGEPLRAMMGDTKSPGIAGAAKVVVERLEVSDHDPGAELGTNTPPLHPHSTRSLKEVLGNLFGFHD